MLACLIDAGTADDEAALTLDALRLACNQTTDRDPVVTFDDRTVDTALLSLKSMGLVRFDDPGHGRPTTRYRHTADARWRLSRVELGVLAALVLRGPQTAKQLRSARLRPVAGDGASIDDALDTLASRRPEPFAVRLEPRAGQRDVRFGELLSDDPEQNRHVEGVGADASDDRGVGPDVDLASLAAEVAFLRARVDRLEHELARPGVDASRPRPGA